MLILPAILVARRLHWDLSVIRQALLSIQSSVSCRLATSSKSCIASKEKRPRALFYLGTRLSDFVGLHEATIMKHQCSLWRHLAMLHLADENHVVALRIAAAIVAFKPGRDAFENRLPGA